MLRKFYRHLPCPIKDGIDQVWGMLPRSLKYGNAYSDMLHLLQGQRSWSFDQIRETQNNEMKRLLCHAYETTEFYRKEFDEAGFNPYKFVDVATLVNLPTINKEVVQNNLAEMLSNAFSVKDRLKVTTGGTSGNQLVFYIHKGISKARETAMIDYLWGQVGYQVGKSRRVVLRNNVLPNDKLWVFDSKENALILDPYHLTTGNCRKIIDYLNTLEIPFFHMYPSSAVELADYMLRSNHRLMYIPKAVFASSENLYNGQREKVEEAFGCKMLIHYGHSELCCFASWCTKNDHYHLEELYGYTELLDDEQKPIMAADKMGEITATGFNNYVLPLIRYRTADYATYAKVDGGCDYHGRIIEKIEGRWHQEMLVTSLGNKISMTAINFHSDIFDRIRFYQFYQDTPGEVFLRIVKGEGYTDRDEAVIKKALSEKLSEYIKLNVVYVEDVERTKNGKYRYIISSLKL